MPTDALAIPYFRELLIFLVVAVAVVPLSGRLKVSPILGFLIAGVAIGPYGLKAIDDVEGVRRLAELGIVFLLFKVGLELSLDRLIQLRRLVFGLGSAQVFVTGLTITGVALAWGNSPGAAVVIGFALALSSTAIVMRLLIERNAIASVHGRTSFSVLLFQDLAVVPILLLVSILGGQEDGSLLPSVTIALGKAALAVVVIAIIGRYVLRWLFRFVASARSPEVFMAMTLLVVLVTSAGTAYAGLSMALGAFLAGLLLAGTEFRHQIGSDIAPFEGLLLGLFFISVGMGIHMGYVIPLLPLLLISVLGLMVIKGTIAIFLARLFGLSWANAVRTGMMISQSGEFAFVVFAAASVTYAILPPVTAHFMVALTAVTMMLSPTLPWVANRAGGWIDARGAKRDQHEMDFEGFADHVIIAGFGRVGQTIAKVLKIEGIPYVAVDTDTRLISRCRAAGETAFFGDGTRASILERLGIARAGVVLIAINDTGAAGKALSEIRRNWPRVPVFVRARDADHQKELRRLGATHLVPETLEASLQLSGRVLSVMGTPLEAVNTIIDQFRKNEYADLTDIIEPAYPAHDDDSENSSPASRKP